MKQQSVYTIATLETDRQQCRGISTQKSPPSNSKHQTTSIVHQLSSLSEPFFHLDHGLFFPPLSLSPLCTFDNSSLPFFAQRRSFYDASFHTLPFTRLDMLPLSQCIFFLLLLSFALNHLGISKAWHANQRISKGYKREYERYSYETGS